MPKQQTQESRYDFRQGRNSAVSPDLLNISESVDLTNVRIDTVLGGITKRTGTQRVHATVFGSPATGVFQWDAPTGKELVAIPTPGGDFCHKTSALGNFTCISPSPAFANTLQSFATARKVTTSGNALILYIAGNRLYSWDGTTLTTLAPSGLPTDISLIATNATRLFAKSISWAKNLYWSAVGDPTNFLASGLATDAGTGPVDTLSGDSINSLEVVGSSLLIGTRDSISRFSGSDTSNIRLSTDTQGLSTEIGVLGLNAIKKFETAVAFVQERGPHVATEAGVQPIGLKVEPDFLNIDPANATHAAVAYHRGRKELWFAIPTSGSGGWSKTVYVYSTRLQAWMGPWIYPFGIVTLARYVDPTTGFENLVAGCDDGFVRLMDVPGVYLDDVLSNGTGGQAYNLNWEPAPHFFPEGPSRIKRLDRMKMDAIIPRGEQLQITSYGDTRQETILVPSREYYNELQNTETFSLTNWGLPSITMTLNAAVGPSGAPNGTLMTTVVHPLENARATLAAPHLSSSLVYTVYVKMNTLAIIPGGIFVYNDATATVLGGVSMSSTSTPLVYTTGGTNLISGTLVPADVLGWYKATIVISGGFNQATDSLGFYLPYIPTSGGSIYVSQPQVVYGAEERDYLPSGTTRAKSDILEYRVDFDTQGRRIRLNFTECSACGGVATTTAPAIYGYELEAFVMGRDPNA